MFCVLERSSKVANDAGMLHHKRVGMLWEVLSACPREWARLLDAGAGHRNSSPGRHCRSSKAYLQTGVVTPLAVERQLVAMCDLVGEDLRQRAVHGWVAAVKERISQIAGGT